MLMLFPLSTDNSCHDNTIQMIIHSVVLGPTYQTQKPFYIWHRTRASKITITTPLTTLKPLDVPLRGDQRPPAEDDEEVQEFYPLGGIWPSTTSPFYQTDYRGVLRIIFEGLSPLDIHISPKIPIWTKPLRDLATNIWPVDAIYISRILWKKHSLMMWHFVLLVNSQFHKEMLHHQLILVVISHRTDGSISIYSLNSSSSHWVCVYFPASHTRSVFLYLMRTMWKWWAWGIGKK